jgi:Kef-type K+ transport system membrane component KefB
VLGSLMNTRALMELIVLNIGYDLGFLPRNVFTMLVIMAVVTTLMTGPLLNSLLPKMLDLEAGREAAPAPGMSAG